ncbi:MAG TPA: flap endonuclease-1 [Candidatus Nanoarchaeia archaeon]|nr:flap endonuclease-1 [Candidatus Nanoarchaeia archaeon]
MGLAIKEILTYKEIEIEDLKGKIVAVDTFNLLYQFLTTIRGRDGGLLTDSKGQVTSHLVGLFSRSARLMKSGLKLAFVFDGEPPELKRHTREKRAEIKREAMKEYKKAVEEEDTEMMKRYASRTSILTSEMIEDAKSLIEAMGMPVIQAPSEGEAQAAFIAKKGDAYAVVSQDFDSLLHGASKLVRNLSITGKRKVAGTLSYQDVKPELFSLTENLNHLGIDQDQMIAMAVLIGTDYNVGGIKGIGPKKALELVKRHKKNFDELFEEAKWNGYFDFPWREVFDTIKKMPVTSSYKLEWKAPDIDEVKELLVKKHDFSEERVEKTLSDLKVEKTKRQQKGLGEFI